ncbi:MAG: NB-ARC domain-containing protein, partial [Cytophagales bacterium]|nr:NB-ARC domain-containing protein [Cytophagales bacterium]
MARAVFNGISDANEFDKKYWVTFGQDGNVLACLKAIWEHLVESKCTKGLLNEEDAKMHISNALENKRVLLVLDDVWSISHLEMLMVTKNNAKSKLLFTTRNSQLAKRVHAKTYDVALLDENDSFKLFCKCAFGEAKIPNDKKYFSKLVKDMLVQCNKLPLTLSVVDSMVGGYSTMLEWECAMKRLQNSMPLDEEYEQRLLSVLEHSFDNLDEAQKCLFFCMVCYPEDYHVKTSDLVEQWVARQDHESENLDMEYWMLEGYATCAQLVNRSMLMVEKTNGEDMLSNMSCHMHDILREMGLQLVKKENKDIPKRERLLLFGDQQLNQGKIMA